MPLPPCVPPPSIPLPGPECVGPCPPVCLNSRGFAASTVSGSGGGPGSRVCLNLQRGPYTQKPSLYMLHSCKALHPSVMTPTCRRTQRWQSHELVTAGGLIHETLDGTWRYYAHACVSAVVTCMQGILAAGVGRAKSTRHARWFPKLPSSQFLQPVSTREFAWQATAEASVDLDSPSHPPGCA